MLRASASLVVALLVAGCAGSSVRPTDPTVGGAMLPGTPIASVEGEPLRLDLRDCLSYTTSFEVREQDVRPLIPRGYEPIPLGGLVPMLILFQRCDKVVVDNQTEILDVGVARTLVRVDVSADRKGATDFHYYVLEVFSDNETVRRAFVDAGLPGTLATVEVQVADDPRSAQVSVNGTSWYEVTSKKPDGNAATFTDVNRDHRVSADGTPSWADYDGRRTEDEFPSAAALQAKAGVASKMGPVPGTLAGLASGGTGFGRVTFGDL